MRRPNLCSATRRIVSDDYEQDMGKVFQELGNKMLQIIEQYSYQNGYAVVFDVSNQQTPVLWAAPSATSPRISSSFTIRRIPELPRRPRPSRYRRRRSRPRPASRSK